MRHDGERRPEEIEAEIERTRADMDATLSAIENRLTPGQLVDQGLDYLRHSGGNEFLTNLNTSVKENPLPVALVGLGVAWLMASSRQGARAGMSAEHGHETMERLSGAATTAREKASSAATRASETLSTTAQAARETMSQAAAAARERASQVGASTRHQWDRARGTYTHLLHEQPLVLGAAGLALGALLAASLPRTRQEEALLGHASGHDETARPSSQAGMSSHPAAGSHETMAGAGAGQSGSAGLQGDRPFSGTGTTTHSQMMQGGAADTASRQMGGTADTTGRQSAPGHDMMGGSDRLACPASDAPGGQSVRRSNPGMDI